MLSAFYYCMIRFYAGDPIREVLDAAKVYRKLCHQYGQHFASSNFDPLIQLLTNFTGDSSDPLVFTGDAMKEEDAFKIWQVRNPISFLFFLNFKHFAAVYLNHYDLAKEMANRIKVAKAKLPPIALVTHHFLQAVGSATIPEQRLFLSKLRDSARHCPDNFLHKVYLVEAELANSTGNYDEALAKYEMSIAQAKRQGFVHEQALACERAGYAMREQGEHDGARHFLTLAQTAYEQWGAHVKADQMAKELERQTI
jgi:tetratricopeptide (TPR) repeat protein